jgi:hypothetical protein
VVTALLTGAAMSAFPSLASVAVIRGLPNYPAASKNSPAGFPNDAGGAATLPARLLPHGGEHVVSGRDHLGDLRALAPCDLVGGECAALRARPGRCCLRSVHDVRNADSSSPSSSAAEPVTEHHVEEALRERTPLCRARPPSAGF